MFGSKERYQLKVIIDDNGIGREEAIKREGRKSHCMEIIKDRIDLLNKVHNMDVRARAVDKNNPKGTIVILRIILLT